MKQRYKAWMPSPESIRNNRWVNWLGPAIHHPRLWHFSRKGIALGLALGIFFGLLIPVAQIPLSAAAAVLLRANVPMAMASTLVTNPVTFGPVYYGAYQLGKFILREPALSEEQTAAVLERHVQVSENNKSWAYRFKASIRWLTTVGKPLVVGLGILATLGGLLTYALINLAWILHTRWSRSKRLRARTSTSRSNNET